jgi:ubiquinone/menaquinone biosynthesis C-methylase UbiE
MVATIDLENKTLLDVGCGFGGVDLYLASKYSLTITAVDREPYMIECAQALLNRSSAPLKGTIQYMTLANPFKLDEFENNSFDLIFCKQTLYHLISETRESYLKEMFRVLKPNGKIIIEDWLTPVMPYTDRVKIALNDGNRTKEPFGYLITPNDYQLMLSNAGFSHIIFTDTTNEQVTYTINEIMRIRSRAVCFSQELSADYYKAKASYWNFWFDTILAHEILSGILTATKQED